MKSVSALFLAFFLFSSCGKLYLRMKYDVRAFKPRTTQELNEYLSEKNIRYDRHYRIREDAFLKQQASPYKPGWKEGLRPVQVRAFDGTGVMVMQWAICEGFIDSMATLLSFPPANEGEFVPMLLKDDLTQYIDSTGRSPVISSIPQSDLYFVVYWSRSLGEMSLGSVRPVIDYKTRYPDKRIMILLVSLDPEKGWKEGR